MRRSIKAALMSALFFPGSGHIMLGRTKRGLLFLLPALLAAVYVGTYALQSANEVLRQVDSGALPLDPQRIAEQIASSPGSEAPFMTAAVLVMLLAWAGSIIDAFVIGSKR